MWNTSLIIVNYCKKIALHADLLERIEFLKQIEERELGQKPNGLLYAVLIYPE